MIKYTEQFKRKIVKQYLNGKLGFKRVAARHGLTAPMIRRWVAAYRIHGNDALCKKRAHYSASFKVSVLQHMWDNALSKNQTAAHFNIRNATSIGIWEKRYRVGGIEALVPAPKIAPTMPDPKPPQQNTPAEQRTLEEVLKENEALRMEVEVLKKLQALVQAQKANAPQKRK